MIKKVRDFLLSNWYPICVVLIIVIAIVLRFYNFDNRWVLARDQARDATIGREAIREHKIPALGPFSQAGTFVMGPIWYWLVALASLIYFPSITTPWIILAFSFVVVVYVMILAAKELGGKYLALIVGIFTAVSASEVVQSSNLTNPSGVAIFSALAIYFAIKYISTKKSLYIFLFPLFVSIAVNVHLQALGVLPLIPITLLIQKPSWKKLFISIAGFVLPFLPLLYFDLRNNFYDLRSFFDFYLYGQYKIYVPNRWLTYITVFWPSAWARIIGGEKILGAFLLISSFLVSIYAVYKKTINKKILTVILSFLGSFIMLRYYRGERFDGYLIFLHPFVLIISGWICLTVFKLNKIVGVLLIALIIAGSLKLDISEIKNSTAHTQQYAKYWRDLLIKTYPGEKFALYDFRYNSPRLFMSLGLYLDEAGKIDDNGYKIGFGTPLAQNQKFHTRIKNNNIGYDLWDLNSSSSSELGKEEWAFVNPSQIYHNTEEWFVGKNL